MLSKNGQASKKGLVLQGGNISEKDALRHDTRGAATAPQHCGHKFEQNLGLHGSNWTTLALLLFWGGGEGLSNISLLENVCIVVCICGEGPVFWW